MLAKVMTFNLRLNVAADGENAWPHRTGAVAEVIRRHAADIIGIQEALHGMLADLESLLPEYAWIGEGREGGESGEYSAILYRKDKWSVSNSGHFSLSETPELLGAMSWNTSHARMCTWARFKSVAGEELLLFNTHLDHISEEAQRRGMELIRERMERMREQTGLSVVLTGDFNAEPTHAVITGLEEAGYRNAYSALDGGCAVTGSTVHHFRGGEAGLPIDYIFTSSDLLPRSVEVDRRLYNGRYPSDHYPVIAEVRRE